MILYYALGGGLGHITRSLSLIEHAPEAILPRVRVLVSTSSARAAQHHFRCPVDRVPNPAMADSRTYAGFLADHIERNRFRCIVMDTFPFGLVGEMKYAVPHIPRVLVGRYLRWDVYRGMCGTVDDAVWPEDAVIIEEQDSGYFTALRDNGFVAMARWPISPAMLDDVPAGHKDPVWCVVHSGPKAEIDELVELAKKTGEARGISASPRVITPSQNIFPIERRLGVFTDIMTGAGYASCAAAVLLRDRVRYHLHPFPRRFDDQKLRLDRLKSGSWLDGRPDGTARAAAILWDLVGLHA